MGASVAFDDPFRYPENRLNSGYKGAPGSEICKFGLNTLRLLCITHSPTYDFIGMPSGYSRNIVEYGEEEQ